HPARLALVVDGGEHRQLLAGAANDPSDWRFALRGIAATADIGVDQSSLVAPVDFGPFSLGPPGNGRIVFLQPLFHGRRRLLVGALDRLLRSEAPTSEVFANRCHVQLDAVFALYQLTHGNARPEREFHLQLLRATILN